MNLVISKALVADLLSGKQELIKNGYLTYNRIVFKATDSGVRAIRTYLYKDDIKLGVVQHLKPFTPENSTLTLDLPECILKVESDEHQEQRVFGYDDEE